MAMSRALAISLGILLVGGPAVAQTDVDDQIEIETTIVEDADEMLEN